MSSKSNTKRGGRRPDLIRAARRLFFSRGYAGTTIEQAARAAGFSKRTVYLYFKNKDDLFISVAEEGLVKLRRNLETVAVADLGVEPSIAAIMEIYMDFAHQNPEYFRMIFRECSPDMVANVSEELRRRLEDHEHACLNVVATVVDVAVTEGRMPRIDRWETAVMFWGMATGILLLSLAGSQAVFGRSTREELISKAIWILYAGLRETDDYFRATGNQKTEQADKPTRAKRGGRKKAGRA
ncbi:MAG: TetR/AcrR family transcriptional regulator [Candidatus Lernaella stagnicola]|nr:TetR/AcrR family transcriptional regulator [Candidatus Lernaella stagnicola]